MHQRQFRQIQADKPIVLGDDPTQVCVPTTDNRRVGHVGGNPQQPTALTSLTASLAGVTDVASAETALPTLEEVNAALTNAQGAVESMPAESRTAIQSAVSAALPTITEQTDRILAESGLAPLLKPVLDGILEKLQAFAA